MPAMPMARPTSDSFRAGASLVPSPVTATMSPRFFSSCTNVNLSWGELRASTCSATPLSQPHTEIPIVPGVITISYLCLYVSVVCSNKQSWKERALLICVEAALKLPLPEDIRILIQPLCGGQGVARHAARCISAF